MNESKTNFIYLLYGKNPEPYAEAAYSIGTLFRWAKALDLRVIVYTDQPEKTKTWPVKSEIISGEIVEMKGAAGFAHRMKLCVISRALASYAGNTVYLDSDTFFSQPISAAIYGLQPGQALMHRFESKNPLPEFAGFQTRLANGSLYQYSRESWMFNAGVIGIHQQGRGVVATALELCDALLDRFGSRCHTIEQFAISEAFRISGVNVSGTYPSIKHYWRSKQRGYMRTKISELALKSGREPWAFGQAIPLSRPRIIWERLWRKSVA